MLLIDINFSAKSLLVFQTITRTLSYLHTQNAQEWFNMKRWLKVQVVGPVEQINEDERQWEG